MAKLVLEKGCRCSYLSILDVIVEEPAHLVSSPRVAGRPIGALAPLREEF